MNYFNPCRILQTELNKFGLCSVEDHEESDDEDQNVDPELRTAALFSKLKSQFRNKDISNEENQETVKGIKNLLYMEHNSQLPVNLSQYFSRSATMELRTSSNSTRVRTIENTKKTIKCIENGVYDPKLNVFDAKEKAELYKALGEVGVSARESPFPKLKTTPCLRVRRSESIVSGSARKRSRSEHEVLKVCGSSKEYILIKELKKALYGNIQQAVVISPSSTSTVATDEQVAIKCISKSLLENSTLDEDPIKELQTLAYITNQINDEKYRNNIKGDADRVLLMIDCLEDDDFYYLIMPCLKEDLFDTIERDGAYTEPNAFAVFKDILSGLEVAHSLGLAHHDVSLENLMLDDEGRAVLIDWGMAVKVPVESDGTPVKIKSQVGWPCQCGKQLYYAPELLDIQEDTKAFDPFKLDIWSSGIVLFMLLTGHPPWDVSTGPSESDGRFQCVINKEISTLIKAWGLELSDDAVELLQALLSRDAADRPSIAQIRKFPWFNTEGGAIQDPIKTHIALKKR